MTGCQNNISNLKIYTESGVYNICIAINKIQFCYFLVNFRIPYLKRIFFLTIVKKIFVYIIVDFNIYYKWPIFWRSLITWNAKNTFGHPFSGRIGFFSCLFFFFLSFLFFFGWACKRGERYLCIFYSYNKVTVKCNCKVKCGMK